MSWSSSLRSNDGPNMRLRTRDRSKPSAPLAPESRSGSGGDSPLVIRPDVTAFAVPSSIASQLLKCAHHLNTALREHRTGDTAFQIYSKLGDTPRLLCETLLKPHPEAPILGPASDTANVETSFGCQPKRSKHDGQRNPSSYFPVNHLEAIRGWKMSLQALHDRLHTSLLRTYSESEQEVTATMTEQLFIDPIFRAKVIQKMKQSKAASSQSTRADDGMSAFEVHFRNYGCVKESLDQTQHLLQLGESGISPGRSTQEIIISQRGDAVLEFANNESDSHPVLRFRVLSHMLSETSPLFARIFDSGGGGADSGNAPKEGSGPGLPQTSVEYAWSDGAQTRLYRMPQLEMNEHGSFELLLHAAHLHTDAVPREIEFETFVALAKVCMRYQCTSPVEMLVEYRWLPQWMHKAIDDMPDGLLMISYAFGLRRMFTRMSKTAILNVVDEDDLQAKPWPQNMKDRIWAVRMAKMGQILACCSGALQEYLQDSSSPGGGSDGGEENRSLATSGRLVPFSKPRCPKGNLCCDATNLGWLMIIFAQQQILPHIMDSPAVAHLPQPPKRSLNQLFDSLRSLVSPPQGHGGVCEYAPAFRGAINDISNSVQGLTLFEVSGQHGWALSRHKIDLPQITLTTKGAPPAAALMTAEAQLRETATAEVALRIMEHVDTWRDLCSVAMVSKAFYAAYDANAGYLCSGMNSTWTGNSQERAAHGGDDDNSTTVGYDFTPPPSEIHVEQQHTDKVTREESERLLRTLGEYDQSMSRDSADHHHHPGPALSLNPTKPLSSSTDGGSCGSGDETWTDKVPMRRNDQRSEKFLASEVVVHFAVKASSSSCPSPAVVPVPEDKNLVVPEDKNLREQRDNRSWW
ncbi:hypothetical protein PG999_000821 [Apiospora kogelbergensis]|uniref:BTB domain-containing protein n=1 Tax=Apiospora kogelbergensis TaxID=1337665 RepID=A0AAW0RCT0_9PEZI